MNKRDFIVQGGSALLASASTSAAWASHPSASPALPKPHTPPASAQASWQALQGQAFHSQTTLGRPVILSVLAVSEKLASNTATGLAQFTVSFQGPRALPMAPGLHQLSHPQTGPVQLYLQPVRQGDHIDYDAHFSLLV
jgi:hypothetical protein